MASEPTKLEQLKAILAKSPAPSGAVRLPLHPIYQQQHAANASDIIGSSPEGDRTGTFQGCRAIGSGLLPTDCERREHDQSIQQEDMRQPSNGNQGGGLSKLEQLKAVLEESRRKKATSPQDVPATVTQASFQSAPHKEALPKCGTPVAGNNCDERDAVETPRMTSPEQISEKVKKLKELLGKQPRKRTTLELLSSPAPGAPDQVSKHNEKCVESSSVALPSSESHSKSDDDTRGSRFPCSRLPIGMPVSVVFLRIAENKKVVYLQEVSALRGLVKMVKALNAEVSKEKQRIEEPIPGDLVAVLHEKDSTWYRGQICSTQPVGKGTASGDGSKKKVRVWFVDYGRWDDVPLECLCRLPNGYERLPGFAIPVTLHGLQEIKLPKGVKFEGTFFDAVVVDNVDRQSVRLHIRNDDLCLNDTLSVYAESSCDASAE